jgi:hypothetical protein
MLEMQKPASPKRSGGQPRNKNAFKHGFYSKYFSAFESRALSDLPLTDMTGEIGLLRVNIDRFMQAYTTSLDELDYENRLAGLRAITLAVGRIAAMRRILSATGKNLEHERALQELMQSWEEEMAGRDLEGGHAQK